MCGIAGIINFNRQPISEKDIRLMMLKMKHRGPDDEGVYIDNNVGLGFVRLSILDLSSAGHQPMHSHTERYVIVFNGEVFNYIEIRDELKSDFDFNTGTDTEVVLAAYQKWGEACLDRFNGMFAFVIFDKETKHVFAARDRFGIKPFYYYQDNEKFIFASEIKSILPLVKRQANDSVIFDYLLYNRTDHTEQTFFKSINKLQHGSFLTVEKNIVKKYSWYILADKIKNQRRITPEEYRELFKDSIKLRLRSDVPVGVSLSGGIDSSSIVASSIKDFNLDELNTFSAVYGKDEPSDESEYIDAFKGMINNMHYTYPTAETFYDDFDSFIDAHNEPVPDIGPYAQYKVMELASKHVTVTLDGQGADEQLAGYHYFFGSYYRELLSEFKWVKLIGENVHYLKKHSSISALKFLSYYILPSSVQKKVNSNIFPSVCKSFLQTNEKGSDLGALLYNPKTLNESLYQHFESKLEHLLRWEDLNAMHFSIESRVPFLDYRLVEATLNTPSNQKLYKGETKYILREALKNILPDKITQRKDKKGFSNPRDKWFRSEKFQSYIYALINSESFKNRGYFDSDITNKRYERHLEGKIDASKEIWKWINLEVWFRKFID
jgi:asparagine synthase (glutamine-hydrolysing)